MEVIFSIIGSIVMAYLLMIGICAIFGAIYTAFIGICEFWEKLNSLGRAVIFGIPFLALSTTIFYFVIWYLIPFIYDNWIIFTISAASGFYISTWFTGFKFNPNMKYKIFSRAFSTAPFLPIIIVFWIFINIFGILFLKSFNCISLIKLWDPSHITRKSSKRMEEIRKLQMQEAFEIIEDSGLAVSKIEYILKRSKELESRQEYKDNMLFEVAKFAISYKFGLSEIAVRSYFKVSALRAHKIIHQLHFMGICISHPENSIRCVMNVNMDELLQLEREGAFLQFYRV